MAEFDATMNLPELLDPVLDYLAAVLPPPFYSTFETLLAHAYTLATSLSALVLSLSKSIIDSRGGPLMDRLEDWWDSLDATVILPPLITLLAAYLALVSFYRTSKWMIRTMFAFVKWGFILTTLGTAAGWYLANANVGGAEAGGANGVGALGVFQTVGGLVNEFLEGHQAQQQHRASRSKSNTRSKTKARPKAYDAWDKHQDWQYSEQQVEGGEGSAFAEVQKVVGSMLMGDGGWWKNLAQGGPKETRKERRTRSR
jgi:hypothetical protein